MLQNNNEIGDDGAIGLGKGLKVNSSLKELNLVRHLFLSLICLLWGRCKEREGSESVFQFVQAVLRGGSFTSRSCRVMVVGPQMVR